MAEPVTKKQQPQPAKPLLLPEVQPGEEFDPRLKQLLSNSQFQVKTDDGEMSVRIRDGNISGIFATERASVAYQPTPGAPDSYLVRLQSNKSIFGESEAAKPGFGIEVGRGALFPPEESLSNRFLHPERLPQSANPDALSIGFVGKLEHATFLGRTSEGSQLVNLTFTGSDARGLPVRFSTTFAHSELPTAPNQTANLLGLKLSGERLQLGADVSERGISGIQAGLTSQPILNLGNLSGRVEIDPVLKKWDVSATLQKEFDRGNFSVEVHPQSNPNPQDPVFNFKLQIDGPLLARPPRRER